MFLRDALALSGRFNASRELFYGCRAIPLIIRPRLTPKVAAHVVLLFAGVPAILLAPETARVATLRRDQHAHDDMLAVDAMPARVVHVGERVRHHGSLRSNR